MGYMSTVLTFQILFFPMYVTQVMFLSLGGSESLRTPLTFEQISLMYIFVWYYDEHFYLILGFYFRMGKVVGVEEEVEEVKEVEGVEEVEGVDKVEGVEEVESLPSSKTKATR